MCIIDVKKELFKVCNCDDCSTPIVEGDLLRLIENK